jgi:hypothetical protein
MVLRKVGAGFDFLAADQADIAAVRSIVVGVVLNRSFVAAILAFRVPLKPAAIDLIDDQGVWMPAHGTGQDTFEFLFHGFERLLYVRLLLDIPHFSPPYITNFIVKNIICQLKEQKRAEALRTSARRIRAGRGKRLGSKSCLWARR